MSETFTKRTGWWKEMKRGGQQVSIEETDILCGPERIGCSISPEWGDRMVAALNASSEVIKLSAQVAALTKQRDETSTENGSLHDQIDELLGDVALLKEQRDELRAACEAAEEISDLCAVIAADGDHEYTQLAMQRRDCIDNQLAAALANTEEATP
jgi:chromosome segregation ATPase